MSFERETDLGRRAAGRARAQARRAADGYAVCPACGHHTSAYCGSCTAFTVQPDGRFGYCGCDCVVAMGGRSLSETLGELLHGPRVE